MVSLLEWISFDELPALVVLIWLLWVTGGQMTRPTECSHRWVRRTAALTLIIYAGLAIDAFGPSGPTDLLSILVRALLAAGLVGGLASIVLPLAHAVGSEMVKAMTTNHRNTAAETRNRADQERATRESNERERRSAQERARHAAVAEEKRRQTAAEATTRAEQERHAKVAEARNPLVRLYDRHESLLGDVYPRELFEAQLRSRFSDSITTEQACKEAEEMIAAMQPLIAQGREKKREEEAERRKYDQRARNIRRQIAKLEDRVKRLSASGLGDPEMTGQEVRAMQEEIRRLENESRAMEAIDEGGMQ